MEVVYEYITKTWPQKVIILIQVKRRDLASQYKCHKHIIDVRNPWVWEHASPVHADCLNSPNILEFQDYNIL